MPISGWYCSPVGLRSSAKLRSTGADSSRAIVGLSSRENSLGKRFDCNCIAARVSVCSDPAESCTRCLCLETDRYLCRETGVGSCAEAHDMGRRARINTR